MADQPGVDVAVSIEVDDCPLPADALAAALASLLAGEGRRRGAIEVAVLGDAAMHALNREQLDHDYTTDTISFDYGSTADSVDGEIMINAELAQRIAAEHGQTPARELLLYAIHATLHLLGYDDTSDAARARMHARQAEWLARLG